MTEEKISEKLGSLEMFGDRDNIMEAFDYAKKVVETSTDPSINVYGTTALAVIWNTLANRYEPLIRKENE